MTLADVVLAKKWELDALRQALPEDALGRLEQEHRIGFIYASNAIDGNALTAGETALIIEKNATSPGKSLKDHLEVAEYAGALAWMLEATLNEIAINEAGLRFMHRLVVGQSIPEISGRYADRDRSMVTGNGAFKLPDPDTIPALMAGFCKWLTAAPNEPGAAFEAHFRIMSIHPFNDGNGRTARLLTNWILSRGGFPIVAIHPDDKLPYLDAIGAGLKDDDATALSDFLFQRLDSTLDIFLAAARKPQAEPAPATATRT